MLQGTGTGFVTHLKDGSLEPVPVTPLEPVPETPRLSIVGVWLGIVFFEVGLPMVLLGSGFAYHGCGGVVFLLIDFAGGSLDDGVWYPGEARESACACSLFVQ